MFVPRLSHILIAGIENVSDLDNAVVEKAPISPFV
jgi:hypothetical protein